MSSSLPDKLKLEAWRGATFELTMTLYEEDEEGPVRDLTDFIAEMDILDHARSSNVLLHLDTENGGITIEPESGQVSLYIAAQELREQEWTSGVYDLTITSDNGEGETEALLYGSFVIKGID